MYSDILIGVIGLLIGVLIGILGPLVAHFIRYQYMKPIPDIQEDEPQQGDRLVRHSIRIANKGRTVAKNCNVLLTIKGMEIDDMPISDETRKTYVDIFSYRPIIEESLCWSFQMRGHNGKAFNPTFLSIAPKSTRLVELCVVRQSESLEIEVPSELGWEIRRVILRGNKEYEVELKIFAENVQYDPKKHSKSFKLIPDSEKEDIEVKPLTP